MLKNAVVQTSVCSPSTFFLDTQLDYISQPPWLLGLFMHLSSREWSIGGNDVCHFKALPTKLFSMTSMVCFLHIMTECRVVALTDGQTH